MKLAIMQPYFKPYIGYFQLINAVDLFIVYDNIKYTKKGWINRNRMLRDDKDVTFSLPLKKDSDSLNIVERELSVDFDCDKLLRQFEGTYWRAPYFEQTFPLLEQIVRYKEINLFRFLHHSITKTCLHLGITTKIKTSSEILIEHTLQSQDKVLALCSAAGATTYINAIGGVALYSKNTFSDKGFDLKFLKSNHLEYMQFNDKFLAWLSIIDVMMFNALDVIKSSMLINYELV